MSKSVNVHEACVITKDDKGNLSLVGKAKEALTTLKKNKVSVNILLCDYTKDDVEKFLNDNNVPFASLYTKQETDKDGNTTSVDPPKADVTIMPSSKFITLRDDWQWCLDDVAHRLWGEKPKEAPKSEQQSMDEAFKRYIDWAKPKKADNSPTPIG
nr:hypothetical protein [uncultured Prevotella sp.]